MAKFTGHTITNDSALGDAKIQRSLRFNDDDQPILTRTPSRGNRKTWTYSCWVKKSRNDTYQGLLAVGTVDGSEDFFGFESSNRLYFRHNVGDDVKSSALLRDLTGWYHIVVVADSTQSQSSSTASDSRIRFYVNGEQLTDFPDADPADMPSQYFDFRINDNALHYIGEYPRINSHLDGYLAEVNFVDGSALDASYFGFTDGQTGIWMPKKFIPPNRPNNGVTWSSTTQFDANVFNGNFSSNFLAQVSNGYYTATTSPFTIKQSLGVITGDGYHWGARFNGSTEVTTGNLSNTMGHDPDVRIVNFDLSGVTLPFDVTNLQLKAGTGSSGSTYIYGIVVDGVVLIDGDISNIGLNGFRFDFNDNSSTSALGKDTSGNGNDHATSNFSVSAGAGNDSVEDTPTNNFATLNPLFMNGTETAGTFSEGNLKLVTTGYEYGTGLATFNIRYGKYYWEVKQLGGAYAIHGIVRGSTPARDVYVSYDPDGNLFGFGYQQNGSIKGAAGTGSITGGNLASGYATFTTNDIIGFASDISKGTLAIYKNNTLIYTITGINDDDWVPAVSGYTSNGSYSINFGQQPFSYTPPTGYKTLSSRNIPPNAPSIIRPQRHFETLLYTGNGSTQSITGLEFAPDFVWIKERSSTSSHGLGDTVRGALKVLQSDQNAAEVTTSTNFTSFDSNGFTHGNGGRVNQSGETYVAWCWKAGGAAVSNGNGNITSSVSVNDEAGFSIVSYTGNGSNGQTVGHGLSQAPQWIILKNRDAVQNWRVWHHKLAADGSKRLILDQINASEDAGFLNDTAPTSTVFTLGNADDAWNVNGNKFIAYCWYEVPGYSKFGSYVGNGNAAGPFVFTGFRPAWIMIKLSGYTGNWIIFDNKRDPFNYCDTRLFANLTNADTGSYNVISMLSNGFKFENQYDGSWNRDNTKFVFMAFAEEPGTTPFDTFPNAR